MSSGDLRQKANQIFSHDKRQWYKIYVIMVILLVLGMNQVTFTVNLDSSETEAITRISLVDLFFPLLSLLLVIARETLVLGAGFKTLGVLRQPPSLTNATVKDSLTGINTFSSFLEYFLLQLLTYVYLFLWYCLFFIPGVVKSFSYAMTDLIYYDAQNSGHNLSYRDAITASRQMMNGHKWTLFKVYFLYGLSEFLLITVDVIVSLLLITLVPIIGILFSLLFTCLMVYFITGIEIRKNIARVEFYHRLRA